jgi:hypothetical protein
METEQEMAGVMEETEVVKTEPVTPQQEEVKWFDI